MPGGSRTPKSRSPHVYSVLILPMIVPTHTIQHQSFAFRFSGYGLQPSLYSPPVESHLVSEVQTAYLFLLLSPGWTNRTPVKRIGSFHVTTTPSRNVTTVKLKNPPHLSGRARTLDSTFLSSWAPLADYAYAQRRQRSTAHSR